MQIATDSDDREKLAKEAAKQLKDPSGPRVAVFELDGFDTHAAQGGVDGSHADELEEVNNIVTILHENLGNAFDNTLILTLTEFGRNNKAKWGYGTEHGLWKCNFNGRRAIEKISGLYRLAWFKKERFI